MRERQRERERERVRERDREREYMNCGSVCMYELRILYYKLYCRYYYIFALSFVSSLIQFCVEYINYINFSYTFNHLVIDTRE